MKTLLTYRGAVQSGQCDRMGHMNVAYYVSKFDEATWALLAALGLTAESFRENHDGVAAVEQRLKYKKELFSGDCVQISSHVVRIGGKVIVFDHEMRDDESGEVVATCEITAVHFDRRTRRACEFPETTIAAALRFMESSKSCI